MKIRIALFLIVLMLTVMIFLIDTSFWNSLNKRGTPLEMKNPCLAKNEEKGCALEALTLNRDSSNNIFMKLSQKEASAPLLTKEEKRVNLALTEGLNQTLNEMASVVQRKNDLIALVRSIKTQEHPLHRKVEENLIKEAKKELFALVSNSSQERLSTKKMVIQAQASKSLRVKKIAKAMLEDIEDKKIDVLESTKSYVLIKVKQGDTLAGLAHRYYGNAKLYKKIYNVNKERVGKKMQIYANTVIMVPKGEI